MSFPSNKATRFYNFPLVILTLNLFILIDLPKLLINMKQPISSFTKNATTTITTKIHNHNNNSNNHIIHNDVVDVRNQKNNNNNNKNHTNKKSLDYYNKKTQQDEKCKRMFEWSMIDHLEANNGNIQQESNNNVIDFNNLPQTKTLTAMGETMMSIKVLNKKLNLTIIDTTLLSGMSATKQYNLWHRMVPQYSSWVALQVAQKKYNLITNRILYYFKCSTKPDKTSFQSINDIPPEWFKIGEVSCDETLLSKADVIIYPKRKSGMLWDLAWDHNFECYNSNMFKTFASLISNKTSILEPLGCFIDRKGRDRRLIINHNETISMMHDIFPRVRIIQITEDHTTDETIDILYDCKVLFGVHGAGLMNTMFARPGVAVVEMTGIANAAYFKNVNMLLGQYYEGIKGDKHAKHSDNFNVDLVEAKAALLRAKEYVTIWIEEHDGKW